MSTKQPICYIAGPIRGVPNYRMKFARAKEALEEKGWIILDPSRLPEGMMQEDYMRICMAFIQTADMVGLLPGWELSEGAKIEKAYADMIGLPVLEIEVKGQKNG